MAEKKKTKKQSEYVSTGSYRVEVDGVVHNFGKAGDDIEISDSGTINILLDKNLIIKK